MVIYCGDDKPMVITSDKPLISEMTITLVWTPNHWRWAKWKTDMSKAEFKKLDAPLAVEWEVIQEPLRGGYKWANGQNNLLGGMDWPDSTRIGESCDRKEPCDSTQDGYAGRQDTTGEPKETIKLLGIEHDLVKPGRAVEAPRKAKIKRRLNRIKFVARQR